MANKPVPMDIVRIRPCFDGNPRIDWVWVWVWEIPTFSIGYGNGYENVHIPAILPVPI